MFLGLLGAAVDLVHRVLYAVPSLQLNAAFTGHCKQTKTKSKLQLTLEEAVEIFLATFSSSVVPTESKAFGIEANL